MGFFDSAMQAYDFVDRMASRGRADSRLEQDRARLEQDRARELQWAEEDRARQTKERTDKDQLKALRAFSYRRQADPGYTPSPQELQLIAPYMEDEKVQGLMSKIYEDPEAAKKSVTNARAALEGTGGTKQGVIEFMNTYLRDWVSTGEGGKKEIADLIPVEDKIVPALKITDEEGKTRPGPLPPMTTYRGTEDRYLRGLDPAAGAALLDHMEEAIDQAIIARGGTGPIKRQAATAKEKREAAKHRTQKDYEASLKRHTLSPGQALYDAEGRLLAEASPKDEGGTFNYQGKTLTGKTLTTRIKQLTPFLKRYGKTSGLDLNIIPDNIDDLTKSDQATTWLKYVQDLVNAPDVDPQTRTAAKEYVDLVNTYLGMPLDQAPADPQALAPQIDPAALQQATQMAVQRAGELKNWNPFDNDYGDYGGSKDTAIQQLTAQIYQELTGQPLAPPSGGSPDSGRAPAGVSGPVGGLPPQQQQLSWNPTVQGLTDFNRGQQLPPEGLNIPEESVAGTQAKLKQDLDKTDAPGKKLTPKELAKAVKEASTLKMPEPGPVSGDSPQAFPEVKAPRLFHEELEDRSPGKTILDPKEMQRRTDEYNAMAFIGQLRELGASKDQALKEAQKKYPNLIK